jgi:putative endonuclease
MYQISGLFAFTPLMNHFVYIIINPDGILYKGYTTNINQRIEYHNTGKSQYTKNKGPWKVVFIKSFEVKSEALKYEKMLKRQNHKYLNWLLDSDKNELL